MGSASSRVSNRASVARRRPPVSNVRPARVKPRRGPFRRARPANPTTITVQPTVAPPIIPIRPPRVRPPLILPPIAFPLAMRAAVPPSPSPFYNSYLPYGYQPGILPYQSIPLAAAAPPLRPVVVPPAPSAPPIYYPPSSGWPAPAQVSPTYNIPASMPMRTAIIPPVSWNLNTDWTGGGVISPGFLGPPL